jgi:hypothetical protein
MNSVLGGSLGPIHWGLERKETSPQRQQHSGSTDRAAIRCRWDLGRKQRRELRRRRAERTRRRMFMGRLMCLPFRGQSRTAGSVS